MATATNALTAASGGEGTAMIERRKKPAAMVTATKEALARPSEPAATLAIAHSMPVAAR